MTGRTRNGPGFGSNLAISGSMQGDIPEGLGLDVSADALELIERGRESGWEIRIEWEKKKERIVSVLGKSRSGASIYISCPEQSLPERLSKILEHEQDRLAV